MVANRIKDLASITKEVVRDARRTLEELLNALSPRSPQPQLVPVPIRNRIPRSPFANGAARRHFSTSAILRASTSSGYTSSISSIFSKFVKQQQSKHAQFVRNNLNSKFWTKTSFGSRPFNARISNFGPHRFVGLGSRSFSSYGGSASKQTIMNLTTGFRCLVSNGTDTTQDLCAIRMEKLPTSSRLTYHGCSSTSEAPNTIKLARLESEHIQSTGCYVEFQLPKMELKIPTMAFMNDEVLESLDNNIEEIKQQITRTQTNIQKIFEAYGSLPIERLDGSIRIHFPNLDPEEAEKLLIELGITEGYVYANEDSSDMNSSTTSFFETESTSLAEFIEETVPGLVSSGSEDSCTVSSYETGDFFHPILSSSGLSSGSRQDPIIVSSDSQSFADFPQF